jgi:hypothetical protein
MQLGAINTINTMENAVQKDFDFSPLEKKVNQLEQNQKYLMYALILLALYTILKK